MRLRYITAFLSITVSLILAASAASRQMPHYDVNGHCEAVVNFGGNRSAVLFNGCMDMEQSAYDQLKIAWAGLPQAVREHCDQVATFGGAGSYSLLAGCVDMELQALEKSSQRQFQYRSTSAAGLEAETLPAADVAIDTMKRRRRESRQEQEGS